MKKLTIADIKATEILSKEERKMVIGGEDPGSGQGQMLIGGRCYNGQCYCDWQPLSSPFGIDIKCDLPCYMANCHVLRIDC